MVILLGNYGIKMKEDFWQRKKVLITGHSGFKGSWLSLWLKQLGAQVCGISLQPEENSLFNQLELYTKIDNNFFEDINNLNKLKTIIREFNPDLVFHLAAQPLVIKSYKNPIETWETNVMGSLKILESLKQLQKKCAAILITTDKVYKNNEWDFGYRENDPLGGKDPYSASKAAAEIAISSWRDSYCGRGNVQNVHLSVATARSGNVIGGGDYSENRLIPDLIKSLDENKPIVIRNPQASRPWQHILEPLSGYLKLAEAMYQENDNNKYCEAFNFGPNITSNKTVKALLEEVFKHCDCEFIIKRNDNQFHEASNLHLQIDKSYHKLGWYPKLNFEKTIEMTLNWYQDTKNKIISAEDACLRDINIFNEY